MEIQIILVLLLNFIISLIGTLAYSVRIVGVRTGKIALTFAVFNILALVSRTAGSIQGPLLSNFVDSSSSNGTILNVFYLIIIVSGIASVLGAILIPTFQRLFHKAVLNFSENRSLKGIIMHIFSKSGINYIKESVSIPIKESITSIDVNKLPKRVLVYNLCAVALLTVGGLAPIYAASISPSLQLTCVSLASVINGVAAILMAIFINPKLSIMTDDVIDGKCSESDFRASVIGMVGSKAVGTFFAVLLLIPASKVIIFVAQCIDYLK